MDIEEVTDVALDELVALYEAVGYTGIRDFGAGAPRALVRFDG